MFLAMFTYAHLSVIFTIYIFFFHDVHWNKKLTRFKHVLKTCRLPYLLKNNVSTCFFVEYNKTHGTFCTYVSSNVVTLCICS